MDITKLYTRNGAVMAAQIKDGAESYPVLMEALGNDVILPGLLAEGWVLTALPLSLVKNGVKLEDYPKEPFTAEMEARYMQDMYDMLGTPVPMQERQRMVHVDNTVHSYAPKSDYTINTREEFLAYLHSIRDTVPDTDFLPVNFFVHPNARFTLLEAVDPKFGEYMRLLAQRRRYSYARFTGLKAFLMKHGLKPDFTIADFMTAYFQWGVDGVQFQFKGQPSVSPRYNEPTAEGDRRVTDIAYALVAKKGPSFSVFCPEGYQPSDLRTDEQIIPWDGSPDIPIRFQLTKEETAILRDMPEGQAIRVRRRVYAPGVQWTAFPADTLSHVICTMTDFDFGGQVRFNGFEFKTASGSTMPISHVCNPEKAVRSAYLMSLSNDFINRRKSSSNASTLKALQTNGLSLYSALMYYIHQNEYSLPPDQRSGKAADVLDPTAPPSPPVPLITPEHVATFVQGNQSDLDEEVLGVLMEFAEGGASDPELADAFEAEARINSSDIYQTLTALVSCTNVTPDGIYRAMQGWKRGEDLTIDFDGGFVKLDGKEITLVANAYKKHVETLRSNQAIDASILVWVEGAIKELGDGSRTGHSGFYCTAIPAWDKAVVDLIARFRWRYIDHIINALADVKTMDMPRWSSLCNRFLGPYTGTDARDGVQARYFHNGGTIPYVAVTAFYQAIKQGAVRFPNPTGGNTIIRLGEFGDEKLVADVAKVAKKYLEPKGDYYFYCDCASFCDNIIAPENLAHPWQFYPVNAIITPDRVLPRPGCVFKEYDGVAAYNFNTWKELMTEAGTPERLPNVIDSAFYAKNELKYFLPDRDLLTHFLGREYSSMLKNYYTGCLELANEWKAHNKHMHLRGFTPIVEYKWNPDMDGPDTLDGGPAFNPSENDVGLPCFRLGKETAILQHVKQAEEAVFERQVKLFEGLAPSDFANGITDYTVPPLNPEGMMLVVGDNIYVSDGGKLRTINPPDILTLYNERKEFPITHLYGAKYVFRTVQGRLYYVEV